MSAVAVPEAKPVRPYEPVAAYLRGNVGAVDEVDEGRKLGPAGAPRLADRGTAHGRPVELERGAAGDAVRDPVQICVLNRRSSGNSAHGDACRGDRRHWLTLVSAPGQADSEGRREQPRPALKQCLGVAFIAIGAHLLRRE